MSIRSRKFVIVIAGLSVCLGAARTGMSADRIVYVDAPYCEPAPRTGLMGSLRYKFWLHGVYLRRACTSHYVMVPSSMSPYMGASPYCAYPGYSPYAASPYGAYGAPSYGAAGAYGYAPPPANAPLPAVGR